MGPNATAHITVRNNDLHVGGASFACLVHANGDCRDALTGDGSLDECTWVGCDAAGGNLTTSDCDASGEGPITEVCGRVDAGYDLTGIMRFPIDYVDTPRPYDVPDFGAGVWDIGRHEIVPPTD